MILDQLEMHRIRRLLQKVNRWAPIMRKMSDAELQGQTTLLQKKLAQGATLEQILPQAFATIREADYRILGLFPYDVQVMGAIVLSRGFIAEMKTGEGKTLTATMPLYLNALTHQGAILVTPNAYLAQRDEEQLAPVYRWLNLSVSTGFQKGNETKTVTAAEKRQWYDSDILYTTASTLAFDYLFNNLASTKEDQYLRPYNYALIDEVDAVLLDEATSPFVVASSPALQSNFYALTDRFVTTLVPKVDYRVNEQEKVVWLTYQGVKNAERYFQISNLYDSVNRELYRHIALALRARLFMKNGHDYVVQEGKVILLDEENGRLMKGMEVNTGIQQAVEQKEKLELSPVHKTAASVTFPTLFSLFNKISGMSGTAKVNENEFINTYNMRVIQIPTNKPVIRHDLPDKIYVTTTNKLMAAIKETETLHRIGRPVLLVTGSVENSEIVSELLLDRGISHNVLNALNISREAAMVKDAGRLGAVTVATNMAGRGTDIKLTEEVRQKGGLAVIGTELLPERVRLQLAGRAGRQGEPGTSQFYVSLEDPFVSQASTKSLQKYYRRLVRKKKNGVLHGIRIRFSLWMLKNREASKAEMTRKQTNKYEVALRLQEKSYYDLRNYLVETEHLESFVGKWISEGINQYLAARQNWHRQELSELISEHFSYNLVDLPTDFTTKKALYNYLKELSRNILIRKSKILRTNKCLNQFYRKALLSALDDCWANEINLMAKLRTYVNAWGMAGHDQGYVYHRWALADYQKMIAQTKMLAIERLLLSSVRLNAQNQLVVDFE